MTVLVAGIGLTLTMLLCALTGRMAAASEARARAQLAADAAALAAVWESGPYGRADPSWAAARYARANGARRVECDCPPGALEMQVEVVVDGVVARARAAIEPDRFAPAEFGAAVRGLHPQLAAAVDRLLAASRGAVWVESGWRDSEDQQRLWEDALATFGDAEVADDWVARPGHSRHELGLAVDLGGDIALALRLIERYDLPLYRPMSWEDWHFELLDSRAG